MRQKAAGQVSPLSKAEGEGRRADPAAVAQSAGHSGIPGEWAHPRFWQALERVAQAARNHRIHWGILPPTKEHAARCVELGCRMLSLGLDVWAVQKGLRAFQAEFEAYFEAT